VSAPGANLGWSLSGLVLFLTLGSTLALLAGKAHTRFGTRALAFATALVLVMLPVALSYAAALLPLPFGLETALGLVLAVFLGVLAFGTYLALLTRVGLEHTQAFTALDHPGFKHFVRLRVRRDGSAVDGYCIGLVDPMAPGSEPVLVDHFTFRVRP
jgi:hypothetical protein